MRELINALKKCSKTKDLRRGKQLHRDAIAAGCHANKHVSDALITMYSKCGSIRSAQELFDRMVYRDAVSWNSLILGYVENGESSVAMELFTHMNCRANSVTFVAALKACTSLATEKHSQSLERGRAIHEQVREYGFDSDIVVATTLVDMYSKCRDMPSAWKVFEGMPHRDAVCWNCLIMGYVENGESSVALELFMSMDCEPNSLTFVAALKACAGLLCLEKGVGIHKQVKERGFDTNIVVANSLLNMYGKCGSMVSARDVFDRMVHRNVASWTSLMLGYVENGESLTAMDLFKKMDCEPNSITFATALKACACLATESEKRFSLERGVDIHRQVRERGLASDLVVANALLNMYGKCGSMGSAREVFDGMVYRDAVSWTSLILGYVEAGESSIAMDLLTSMDCEANSVTYVAALKACAGFASENESEKRFCLERGMAIHKQMRERTFDSDTSVANALLNMYSKCGCVVGARVVFDQMFRWSSVSWNSLVLGYVENGESSTAMDLFASMYCKPTSVTFVAALKACGSLAALPSGKSIHANICAAGLEQEETVSNCLVDFYGKCAITTCAEQVFNGIHSPDVVSWNALIAGYSKLGHAYGVFNLARQMHETGVQMNDITFTCILTACSHAGMVEEGNKYFNCMSKYGITPSLEHHTCMVDMLGRANKFEEAFSIASVIPFQSDNVTSTALLQVKFDALVTRT